MSIPATRADAPVFTAPWQAQVFALVTRLRDSDVLGAQAWSQALGARLAALPQDAGAEAVWRCWVEALEDCLVGAGIARPLQLMSLRQSWLIAAEKTPHGEPIRLGSVAYRLAGLAAVPGVTATGAGPEADEPADVDDSAGSGSTMAGRPDANAAAVSDTSIGPR